MPSFAKLQGKLAAPEKLYMFTLLLRPFLIRKLNVMDHGNFYNLNLQLMLRTIKQGSNVLTAEAACPESHLALTGG